MSSHADLFNNCPGRKILLFLSVLFSFPCTQSAGRACHISMNLLLCIRYSVYQSKNAAYTNKKHVYFIHQLVTLNSRETLEVLNMRYSTGTNQSIFILHTKQAENTKATASVTQKTHQITHQLVFLWIRLSPTARVCFEMIK